MNTKNEVGKTDPNFRTWDKGDNGLWSSRPATIEEAKNWSTP